MNPEKFLGEKYADLPGSRPVERAVQKVKHDSERKKSPHSRDERIRAYLDRIEGIVDDERGWEHLKHLVVSDFVLDTSNPETVRRVAHALFESEKRIAIEQGRGAEIARLSFDDSEIVTRYERAVYEKRDTQEKSLSAWLDYLKQNDAKHPMWFRYLVVRNLRNMGTLDKEKLKYTKRTDDTIAPFPELNAEALGYVFRKMTEGVGDLEVENGRNMSKGLTTNFLRMRCKGRAQGGVLQREVQRNISQGVIFMCIIHLVHLAYLVNRVLPFAWRVIVLVKYGVLITDRNWNRNLLRRRKKSIIHFPGETNLTKSQPI